MWNDLDTKNYTSLLGLAGGYRGCPHKIQENSWENKNHFLLPCFSRIKKNGNIKMSASFLPKEKSVDLFEYSSAWPFYREIYQKVFSHIILIVGL